MQKSLLVSKSTSWFDAIQFLNRLISASEIRTMKKRQKCILPIYTVWRPTCISGTAWQNPQRWICGRYQRQKSLWEIANGSWINVKKRLWTCFDKAKLRNVRRKHLTTLRPCLT